MSSNNQSCSPLPLQSVCKLQFCLLCSSRAIIWPPYISLSVPRLLQIYSSCFGLGLHIFSSNILQILRLHPCTPHWLLQSSKNIIFEPFSSPSLERLILGGFNFIRLMLSPQFVFKLFTLLPSDKGHNRDSRDTNISCGREKSQDEVKGWVPRHRYSRNTSISGD